MQCNYYQSNGKAQTSAIQFLELGNGQNTVSRVLFRKRELTEFLGELCEFFDKLGELAFAHTQNRG